MPSMADAKAMRAWAMDLMLDREPDFIIGEAANPYMRRWWVIPRNEMSNVYLHEILRDDDDRALHDHPWANTSILLSGSYIEHTPEGSFVREAGSIVHRQATDSHRLEVERGSRVVSLFITGPKVRDWGFHCPKGWVAWQDFTSPLDKGLVGRGCE